MKLIEWLNGITKLNKTTMDKFQDNINDAITEVEETLEDKQDNLIAGNGITIEKNEISASLNDIYATTETKIGTWTDNKPIYRIVLTVASLPNAGNYQFYPDIPNVETLITCRAMARSTTESFALPAYYDSTHADTVLAMFSGNTISGIRIKTYSDRSSYSGFVILEYTKTTD